MLVFMAATVIEMFPRREPSDQDKAANLATKFEVNGWPCVAVGTNGSPIRVLLIDGFVVGRLTQIPWLASHGFRLVSVSGRPSIEAPSLVGLVQRWLADHGALLVDRRERGIR